MCVAHETMVDLAVVALMLVDVVVMTWAEADAARRESANSDSFIVQASVFGVWEVTRRLGCRNWLHPYAYIVGYSRRRGVAISAPMMTYAIASSNLTAA